MRAAGLLCAAERSRRAAARAAEEEAAGATARAWRDVRRALTGERGLWAAPGGGPEPHWRLDSLEDPSRRRALAYMSRLCHGDTSSASISWDSGAGSSSECC